MAFAVITGASKGIGKEMAVILAKGKHDVLLIARSAKELNNLAGDLKKEFGIKALVLPIDLSTAESAKTVGVFIVEQRIDIDILINNAGYGVWGAFDALKLDEQLNMMQLNMQTLVALTHTLLPFLQKNKQSYILNIASTAAYQSMPFLSAYAATKSFVVSFSRGLHEELKSSGVSVTCVSPGPTDTSFMDRAGMVSQKIIDAADKFGMSAEAVAQIGIKAMFNKETETIPGGINKLTAIFPRFIPKKLIERTVGNLYKP
jgi:short-subunit dehydrogenase